MRLEFCRLHKRRLLTTTARAGRSEGLSVQNRPGMRHASCLIQSRRIFVVLVSGIAGRRRHFEKELQH